MRDEISVRQWQEQFRAGAFDSKDNAVQREAGWWHWCCREDAVAGRLKRIAPVVMGIKSPFILDHCAVWFTNERTEHKLLYDSVRFELLNGTRSDTFLMADFKDPRQPDIWTLYTKRFGFHAPEFGCGRVRDMTEYIDQMAHEVEQGVIPPFLAEKAAAVEYILHRPVIYPSKALRREGEHGYSFLDRDDHHRKMIHVFRSLEEIPPDIKASDAREINGLYIYCPEDAAGPRPERTEGPKKFQKKGVGR